MQTIRPALPPNVLRVPIVGAPLAGGPTTPALVAAVCETGGLGFLAAGYKTAPALADDIEALRRLTRRPFAVNVFYPVREQLDDTQVAAYVERLAEEAERYGVATGEPRWTDDDWHAKLELVRREQPAVVSFTFGCPEREVVEELRSAASSVWCTVTSPAEAEQAASAGVDVLVVQGGEAGGHQGSFRDHSNDPFPLLTLLQLVRRVTDLPLVAAGGIATAEAIAAVLAAGASAAQLGTALLLTPEAGTSAAHRQALRGERPTRLTRAFTGRRARGIVNRFMLDHDAAAPIAYPEIHYVTAPIRAAARASGDGEAINLWAGQAYQLTRERPASELVEDLVDELARFNLPRSRSVARLDFQTRRTLSTPGCTRVSPVAGWQVLLTGDSGAALGRLKSYLDSLLGRPLLRSFWFRAAAIGERAATDSPLARGSRSRHLANRGAH